MTYTLFYSPGTASLAVHWMLIELGAPFALVLTDIEAGAQKDADYLKLNPAGRVPTLMIDGRPHAEVAALLMLLAEREGNGRFDVKPGAPERADYLQRMFSSPTPCSPPSAPGSIRTSRPAPGTPRR